MAATELEVAWAAGIIDGEGCLSLHRHGKNTPYFSFLLKVTMGHKPTILRLQELFNTGSIQVVDQWQYNPAWSWLCTTRQAEGVIKQVYPYIVTKREEADIALEYLALPTNPGTKVTPEVLEVRLRFFERLRDAKPSARFRVGQGV